MNTRCDHDDIDIVDSKYVCSNCNTTLNGDPVQDKKEFLLEMAAEAELMELLGK